MPRTDYATVAYSAATGAQLWVKPKRCRQRGQQRSPSVAVSPPGGTVYVPGVTPIRTTPRSPTAPPPAPSNGPGATPAQAQTAAGPLGRGGQPDHRDGVHQRAQFRERHRLRLRHGRLPRLTFTLGHSRARRLPPWHLPRWSWRPLAEPDLEPAERACPVRARSRGDQRSLTVTQRVLALPPDQRFPAAAAEAEAAAAPRTVDPGRHRGLHDHDHRAVHGEHPGGTRLAARTATGLSLVLTVLAVTRSGRRPPETDAGPGRRNCRRGRDRRDRGISQQFRSRAARYRPGPAGDHSGDRARPAPYVLYSIFLTPSVVLFTSTSIADVPATDAQRVEFTLIGSALILLASAITLRWAHYQQAHSQSAAAEP